MKKILTIPFFILLTTYLTAQTIPFSKRVDWSSAGTLPNNPVITNTLNAMNMGAHGDGITDDYSAITNAISSFGGHAGILYFPPGNYLIQSPITLPDSIIIRGDCSDSANFIFNLSSTGYDCFVIQSNVVTSFQNILAGFTKDTTVITVANASGFNVNDWAEIQQSNGPWNTVPATWATYCVGQLVKITAINGNNLSFQNPLRITYSPADTPQVRKWTPRVFVGIEDINVTRIDSLPLAGGCNFNFTNALNCWVKGVGSAHSMGAHVSLTTCSNITVSGCFFHDAAAYDGGATRGYGVMPIQHAGQCLIENNVFSHLRHSIIMKQGDNGNVAAYNFAVNGYRSESPNDAGGDFLCHGHYPFANLFEGNIGNNITVDETWGPAGPYNTFYRNRAALYGIIMSSGTVQSDSLNWVGNETTDNAFLHGLYILYGTNHYLYGNNIIGTINPTGTTNLTDTSYYRTSFSDFWTTAPFPPTVGEPVPLGTGSNPAKDRYAAGGRMTVSPNPPCIMSGVLNGNSDEVVSIYPNPNNGNFTITYPLSSIKNNLQIMDITGRVVYQESLTQNQQSSVIHLQSTNGIYFVRLINDKQVVVRKIAIKN